MCPPTASPVAIDLWTDEAIIMLLEDIMQGHSLPSNVIADFNPYDYPPSNLPDGIWYFLSSEVKKDTELGSWKAKGNPCEIFTNSNITGWRTTLEFCEGQSPDERRTDWVMQEYRITQKGLFNNSRINDSRTLCRLFCSEEQIPDHVIHPEHGGALPNAKADNNKGQKSTSEAQGITGVDESVPLSVAPLSVAERHECVLNGDFLELDDLDDPQSPSSSLDNSSCPTFTSDELFDSTELLRDLGNENIEQQGKGASFKYTVSTSIKPNEVVMRPATLGTLSAGGSQKSDFSLPEYSAIKRNIDEMVMIHAIKCSSEITSHSPNAVESSHHRVAEKVASSSQNAVPSSSQNAASNQVKEKRRKNGGDRKKQLKKYFCCMPF